MLEPRQSNGSIVYGYIRCFIWGRAVKCWYMSRHKEDGFQCHWVIVQSVTIIDPHIQTCIYSEIHTKLFSINKVVFSRRVSSNRKWPVVYGCMPGLTIIVLVSDWSHCNAALKHVVRIRTHNMRHHSSPVRLQHGNLDRGGRNIFCERVI